MLRIQNSIIFSFFGLFASLTGRCDPTEMQGYSTEVSVVYLTKRIQ
jgi:hypothetical protein